MWGAVFYFNSCLLGVGLAMDAFSVSLADGLNEPQMTRRRRLLIAGVFAFCQALMPLLGWLAAHLLFTHFAFIERLIPWLALLLLGFLGCQMLREGLRNDAPEASAVSLTALLLQGLATSIDALSVGLTLAAYTPLQALVCAALIAAVTLVICLMGLHLGRRAGLHLSGRASILGGCILIFIGLEIFIRGILHI